MKNKTSIYLSASNFDNQIQFNENPKKKSDFFCIKF